MQRIPEGLELLCTTDTMSVVSVERLHKLKARAIEAGARPEFWPDMGPDGKPRMRRVLTWDVSLNCETPVTREFHSHVSELVVNRGKLMPPETVILTVRCRKCEVCRNMRQRFWAGRAQTEIESAHRTWFCTFTVKPEIQVKAEYTARLRLTKAGVNFDELTQFQRFSERVRELSPELTLFFKRIRKNSGSTLRYLVVAEEHTSGLPHFHALLHDVKSDAPLHKQVIEDGWQIGYSKSRLLNDKKGANYVCKYLAKSMLVRVRASLAYGKCESVPDSHQNALGRSKF